MGPRPAPKSYFTVPRPIREAPAEQIQSRSFLGMLNAADVKSACNLRRCPGLSRSDSLEADLSEVSSFCISGFVSRSKSAAPGYSAGVRRSRLSLHISAS